MNYEPKTPLVIESIDMVRSATSGLEDGSMEIGQVNALLRGAQTLQSAVAIDLKARIMAPKIAAAEAKLLENEQKRALSAGKSEKRER